MISDYKKIDPNDFSGNIIQKIGFDWMLITAGNPEKFNTMTASWGGMGFLWNKPVAFIFIRPQRFTYEFAELNEYYTLHFFEEKYREILNFVEVNLAGMLIKLRKQVLLFLTAKTTMFISGSHTCKWSAGNCILMILIRIIF